MDKFTKILILIGFTSSLITSMFFAAEIVDPLPGNIISFFALFELACILIIIKDLILLMEKKEEETDGDQVKS